MKYQRRMVIHGNCGEKNKERVNKSQWNFVKLTAQCDEGMREYWIMIYMTE